MLIRSLVVAVLAIAAFSPDALAERRRDDSSSNSRDDSLWSETESRDSSRTGRNKCGIEQKSGKIRIKSNGKGGSAAYVSEWTADWTDSFVFEFEHLLASSQPGKSTQSATSGIALGFGTFNAASGWTDGINVAVVRTKTTRQLQATVRVGGAVVQTVTGSIGTGAHDLRLVWTSFGGEVSMSVFADERAAPVLTVSGLEERFAGHEADGMGISLFGTSTGNFKFDASFDNVTFSGDDFDDADDAGYDDDDGADDADEDGDDEAEESADAAAFAAALAAADAESALPTFEAEVDDVANVAVLRTLKWDAADGEFVLVTVRLSDATVVGSTTWVPTAHQLAEYQESIDALAVATVTLGDAVAQALADNPGATFHEAELEDEGGNAVWKIELLSAAGAEIEVEIAAN